MQSFGEIDGKTVYFTKHSLSRMVEMKLAAPMVRCIIQDPEQIIKSKKYDGFIYRLGDYSLAIQEHNDCLIVITCLYSNTEAYKQAEKKGRVGVGRTVRPNAGIPRY